MSNHPSRSKASAARAALRAGGMTAAQSKRLKVGASVRWIGDGPSVNGVVTEANWHAVKIAWEDGPVGIIDHRDMLDVEILAAVPA